MTNISHYQAGKYNTTRYILVEDGIYLCGNKYVTSLAFEQEPDYGEGYDSSFISQYPLEDILDNYSVYISDFYDNYNSIGKAKCILEFASETISDIRKLRSLIGKTVHTLNGELIIF